MDIFSDNALALEGGGWYPLEEFRNESFRWVSNDARLTVATLRPVPYGLALLIEPGPGVGLKPFELKLLDSEAKPVGSVRVAGKQTVTVPIPAGEPRIHRLVLHVDGGDTKALRDNRILNFRVFKLGLIAEKGDIVPVGKGLKVGAGWGPLETFNNETFRWAGKEATLEVAEIGAKPVLQVEPGPGVDRKPFKLTVLDDAGTALEEIEVKGREIITLRALPAGKAGSSTYRLRVDGGGKTTPGDSRVMNFRAFSIDHQI